MLDSIITVAMWVTLALLLQQAIRIKNISKKYENVLNNIQNTYKITQNYQTLPTSDKILTEENKMKKSDFIYIYSKETNDLVCIRTLPEQYEIEVARDARFSFLTWLYARNYHVSDFWYELVLSPETLERDIARLEDLPKVV
jgi:predicted S18 family serine protease